MGIGATGIILLVLVALLLFGPNKLPELGRAVGKTLREFKRGANDLMDEPKERAAANSSRVDVTPNEDEQPKASERRLPE